MLSPRAVRTVLWGADDRVIDTEEQSARLHRELPKSEFSCLAGEGHMIQQTATSSVMAAIDTLAGIITPNAAFASNGTKLS